MYHVIMSSLFTNIWGEILINVIAILLSWHRSEGTVQVLLLILMWLVAALGHKTREDWTQEASHFV